MAVKIRLKRMGKIRTPFYRVVVADSRTKRDGRVIEEIGTYNPKAEPSIIKIDAERAQYWLGSARSRPRPSPRSSRSPATSVARTESTLKFAEPKRDKDELFHDALKDLHSAADADQKAAAKKAPSPRPTRPPRPTSAAEEPCREASAATRGRRGQLIVAAPSRGHRAPRRRHRRPPRRRQRPRQADATRRAVRGSGQPGRPRQGHRTSGSHGHGDPHRRRRHRRRGGARIDFVDVDRRR